MIHDYYDEDFEALQEQVIELTQKVDQLTKELEKVTAQLNPISIKTPDWMNTPQLKDPGTHYFPGHGTSAPNIDDIKPLNRS
jgi:hypothetical protein